MTRRIVGVVLGAMLLGPASAGVAGTVISDQVFATGTWEVGVASGTNVTGVSIAREIGAGITGDAQRTTVTGSGSYTFDVQHFKTDVVWDPATQGAITTLGWEVWYRVRNASEFAGMQLAARQGDTLYRAPATYFEPQLFATQWQRTTRSIAAAAFNRFAGPGPADLEFTFDADPIEFGYLLSRGIFRSGTTNYRTSFYVLDIESTPLVLPGDYNGDGGVNAADYTLWRDGDPSADGDGSGSVDAADYALWRDNYGLTAPSGVAVPEPATIALLNLLVAYAAGWRSAKRR